MRLLTLEQIRTLYAERLARDFPPDEVKALSIIEESFEKGEYLAYGWAEGGAVLAYAFFMRRGRTALFDYFAVAPELRGRGVGSRFMQALIAGPLREMDCVLLEVDDPDFAPDANELAIRNRRLRFYQRNGLRDTGVRATVWGVEFRVLALPVGAPMTTEAAARAYDGLYRAMLPKALYDAKVRIH